jgi:hypothetical protein
MRSLLFIYMILLLGHKNYMEQIFYQQYPTTGNTALRELNIYTLKLKPSKF